MSSSDDSGGESRLTAAEQELLSMLGEPRGYTPKHAPGSPAEPPDEPGSPSTPADPAGDP